MTLWDRISLTWRYGKGIFLIGAVYNLICAALQAGKFSYMLLVDSFIIKAVIVVITVYLVMQLQDRNAIFFYINLGLSRRKMVISIILIDFLALAILMTIMFLIHG